MPLAMLGKVLMLALLLRVCRSDSRGASLLEGSMVDVDIAVPVNRRDLQQIAECGDSQWQCSGLKGQQMRLSDSAHAAVVTGNCSQVSALLNLWQCGPNLVQGDVITAVKLGNCLSECADLRPQLCSAPPAPTPAPSESRRWPCSHASVSDKHNEASSNCIGDSNVHHSRGIQIAV